MKTSNTLLPVDVLARTLTHERNVYDRTASSEQRRAARRRIDSAVLALGEDFTARLLVGSLDDSD